MSGLLSGNVTLGSALANLAMTIYETELALHRHKVFQAQAHEIVRLFNIKQVATKANAKDDLKKSIDHALARVIEKASTASEPGPDQIQWPHRPGPNPFGFGVAGELMGYANTLTDAAAQAAFNQAVLTPFIGGLGS